MSERIYETASYKNVAGKYRCLVWVNGFYEWKWLDDKTKEKIPYFICIKDRKPFALGGIYTKWTDTETGELSNTCSMVSTAANKLMAEIHNSKKRMPLVLTTDNSLNWLKNGEKIQVEAMMHTSPDGLLTAHTISKLITSRGVDMNVPEVQLEYKY